MADLFLLASGVAFVGWLVAFTALASAHYWRKRAMYYMDEMFSAQRATFDAELRHLAFVRETDRLCDAAVRDDSGASDELGRAARNVLRGRGRGRLS